MAEYKKYGFVSPCVQCPDCGSSMVVSNVDRADPRDWQIKCVVSSCSNVNVLYKQPLQLVELKRPLGLVPMDKI